jgi:hypothetical protein
MDFRQAWGIQKIKTTGDPYHIYSSKATDPAFFYPLSLIFQKLDTISSP